MTSRRPRAYALATVLLVSVVLSGAVMAMLTQLGTASKLAGRTIGQRKAQYLCEGVSTVAGYMMEQAVAEQAPSSGVSRPENLPINLEPLRRGVAADGIEIEELSAQPTGESRISVLSTGPLAGLETAVVDLELRIALKGPNTPPCQARMSQPLASVSLFQFPAMSATSLNVSPTFSARMDVPRRGGIAWGQLGSSAGGVVGLFSASGRNAPLTLPSPIPPRAPINDPDRFVPFVPLRGDLKFLVSRPGSTGHIAKADVYAYLADLRIIDGEWYLKDLADPMAWPGTLIWSDHPCNDAARVGDCSNAVSSSSGAWRDGPSLLRRRLYSRYERNGRGFLDFGGGNGVISYGSVRAGTVEPATFLSPELCDSPPGDFADLASCVAFTAPPERTGKGGPRAALLDAARGGFVDPSIGPILPVNLDVDVLGFAMNERRHGELGEVLCLPLTADDPGPCTRVFNGILYISTSHGSAITAAGGVAFPAPHGNNGAKLPWPLCGALSSGQASMERGEDPGIFTAEHFGGCDDANWAKPNAVRIVRGNASAFTHTGLTIVSDLPVYVQGGFNHVPPGAGARTAIIAERVTALSTAYSDHLAPPLGSAVFPDPSGPLGPPTPEARLFTSIMAGTSSDGDVFGVVRAIENDIHVRVRGAVAVMHRSGIADRKPPSIDIVYPDALFRTSVLLQPPGAPRATFAITGSTRR